MFYFSHSCVLFCYVFLMSFWFCLFDFCFLELLFTRSCPAVLACPRYPLNALYEKAVSVYAPMVCLCERWGGGRWSCAFISFSIVLFAFYLCCLPVAKGIYEGYIRG